MDAESKILKSAQKKEINFGGVPISIAFKTMMAIIAKYYQAFLALFLTILPSSLLSSCFYSSGPCLLFTHAISLPDPP